MPNVAAEAGSATKAADKACPPTCICDLSRHQNSVTVVRWSRDGKLLASGDEDRLIMLWDTTTMTKLHTFKVKAYLHFTIETLILSIFYLSLSGSP